MSAPEVLFLSSFFHTDRILLYGECLERVSDFGRPRVWSPSVAADSFAEGPANARYFEPFVGRAEIRRELTAARQLLDHVWDHTGLSRSRESYWRLRRRFDAGPRQHLLRGVARVLPARPVAPRLEAWLERRVIRKGYSRDAERALRASPPALVVAMCPFIPVQMSVVAAARRLGIPVVAYITSWDNITTKTRLLFDYDAYVCWSDAMRDELHAFYPRSRARPAFVVGAPQFDLLRRPEFRESRAAFCARYGLDPSRKIVLYALGSPNMIREDFGALGFARRLAALPEADRIELLVRAHPGFAPEDHAVLPRIRAHFPRAVVSRPDHGRARLAFQTPDSIREWIASVRHADVLINTSSSMTVDAALCDTPIVNVAFDPDPERTDTLVNEVSTVWNHFGPVARSGGLELVADYDEMVAAVRRYLADPARHRAGRQRIARRVCQFTDGRSSVRLAHALRSLVARPLREAAG